MSKSAANIGKVKILLAPPEYYPGNAGTFLLQGPSKKEVHEKLRILEHACLEMGMKEFEVVDDRPDPNGGWKCLILTHNWNPLTWVHEQWDRGIWGKNDEADYKWGQRTLPPNYAKQYGAGQVHPEVLEAEN